MTYADIQPTPQERIAALLAENARLREALESVIDLAEQQAKNERVALDHPINAAYLDAIEKDVENARAALKGD